MQAAVAALAIALTAVSVPTSQPANVSPATRLGGAATFADAERFSASGPRLGTDGTLSVIDLDELMTFALADIAAFWNRTQGRVLSIEHEWVFEDGQLTKTACGNFLKGVALYCPTDDTVYLSYELAATVHALYGDMAVVAILAHEFGHNLQAELGLGRSANDAKSELQADCLAGAYIQNAASRRLLAKGDRLEALTVIRSVGDIGPSDDPHGTPRQRYRRLRRGMQRGWEICLPSALVGGGAEDEN